MSRLISVRISPVRERRPPNILVVREKWPTLRLGRVSQNKRLELLLAGQKNHAALVFAAIWYFPSHVFSTSTGEVIRPL